MKVVTSHQNLDFDGLAAMLAYNKLNPDTKMVLPPKLNQNVRAFYSLYKDTFSFVERINFDLHKVNTLTMVDTSDEKRIGKLSSILPQVEQLIIYDHHEYKNLSQNPTIEINHEVGATSTILVEELMNKEIELSPLEATVIAMGIYEDTGNLTFSHVTARDVRAVAQLLEWGADVDIIRDYVTIILTQAQRGLLDELISNTKYLNINDYEIGLSITEREEYFSGAAALVHKLMEIEDVDLFFIIVKMDKKVFVIGRSRREEINVSRILSPFSGKGHDQAASATIKHGDLQHIETELIESLKLHLPVLLTAKAIMSAPVKTISSSTTIQEADHLLHKYGHSGLPVVQDKQNDIDDEAGKIVGVISRRDIEKAKHHGFGHSPVKGYMSQKVISISPDTSIKEIQHLMVSNDIGRLPVIDSNANLIGIVTRTNLLKIQHGQLTEEQERTNLYLKELDEFSEDITELMARRLPSKILGVLYLIGQKADKEGFKVYGVGGFIRDLLLGKDNLDIDLVIEQDAISFAKLVSKHLNGDLKTFSQFQTARLTLRSGTRIDFATARIEYYAFPAASPEVEESTIKQDLYRRDFTINTLAVELNCNSFGKLLDFFGGTKDLKKGVIRVLYNLSFVEDPTRIFRAIRFESRFNFNIEEQTLIFIKNSLETGVLDKLPGERLYEELRNIVDEDEAVNTFRRMDELGIFTKIFPNLNVSQDKLVKLQNIYDILNWYERENKQKQEKFVSKEAMVFSCLLQDQPLPIISSILERLKVPQKIRDVIITTVKETESLSSKLEYTEKNSELVQNLEEIPLETILFVLADKENQKIKNKIYYYLEELIGAGVSITGEDLKTLGIKPGPVYKTALEEVRKARLDGLVTTPEEELEYVLDFFEQKGEDMHG
ncbi:CBS domain-containing protein [Natranaerobius thermophilus]|uniref:CBS domain containing protein n=1 Tax=Natranaerobius thermophilus (strain ATCC BAA-1301 / DSM 18059 / JW/NM-WN-LF) TaxID=457570 RepID=B2A4Y6_NATTJ|nr:CBS domain-containing protein [Natranaerobius thermophilus]ACB85228.1 CBS domain containing protein [Natranaerobius thermophilus JW/NM-WN-LF]